MAHMDPRELETTTRKLPEHQAREAESYLDSLSDRQRRDKPEGKVRRWWNRQLLSPFGTLNRKLLGTALTFTVLSAA